MSISVAMATYNGEKYLQEQLDSILKQLSNDDELIISDDNSTDNTSNIIKEYMLTYSNISLINGPCKGIIKNFENAILKCKNEYIFLCDQDDIWCDNKVNKILSVFNNTNADLILHNSKILYNDEILDKTFFDKRVVRKGIKNNIIKNSYIGCCMAFKSRMIDYFIPFPEKIPMHDQWIGILSEKYGRVEFIDEPLTIYRRHGDNASGESHSSTIQMIKWRVLLVQEFKKRIRKINKEK